MCKHECSQRLTFEVSDGVMPMQLHCGGSPVAAGSVLDQQTALLWLATRETQNFRNKINPLKNPRFLGVKECCRTDYAHFLFYCGIERTVLV